MDNQTATMETAPKHHGYMLQITKLTLKGEKKICWQSLSLFKGEGRVESVKDLCLVEHKSSQEFCTIMINISLIPRLDTIMYSHGELNKCPAI